MSKVMNTDFKELLSQKLQETKERTMFSSEEVQDALLDLWNALEVEPEPVPNTNA